MTNNLYTDLICIKQAVHAQIMNTNNKCLQISHKSDLGYCPLLERKHLFKGQMSKECQSIYS